MTQSPDKPEYKKTVNLPRTGFSMKANLVQNEPASQKRWAKMSLYQRMRDAGQGKPRYVFHDGPPYANGSDINGIRHRFCSFLLFRKGRT